MADLLKQAMEMSFVVPGKFSNARPVVLRISPDTTSSSRHFVKRIGLLLGKACAVTLNAGGLEDPSDYLLELVEQALEMGVYPILIIERFHAFVDIVDDHLLSTLSTLRSLEHEFQITTIAISPISYAQMRKQMAPTSAFVSSSYGDNHDRAVPTPLSKDDFVAGATLRGLKTGDAHKLHQLGGGPDLFYERLIEAKLRGGDDVIGATLASLGDHVATFMKRSFSEIMDGPGEILARLGLGALTLADQSLLQSNALKAFLVKETDTGPVASTPILARWAIMNGQPEWRAYELSMEALHAREYDRAVACLSGMRHGHPRLKCFADVVNLLATLGKRVDNGMLSVDWDRVGRSATLVAASEYAPLHVRDWARQLETYSKMIAAAFSKGERVQLDKLTVLTGDPLHEKLLIFLVSAFIEKARRLSSPTAKVKALATVPEAIMQAIAAARCNIRYTSAPELDPSLPYADFFAGPGKFRVPEVGTKLDLTALLVVVSAAIRGKGPDTILSDQTKVARIQSKLVQHVRNPYAHTEAVYDEQDAKYLIEVSDDLMTAWKAGASVQTTANPLSEGAPTANDLSGLLYGDLAIDGQPSDIDR
ncbi:hypothetical protein [Rhizobium phaseoli]|uniref:hypothetical protein n=1 Tax=Rhizobium phaseoli TaxID=396 RepID=UPI0011AE32D8|nr:hypothetical protein [Rhizobium phaseoli]